MNKIFCVIFLLILSLCLMGQKPCTNNPIVKDIDGNIYNTIQIGSQCWMKENLKVSKFKNGVPIPLTSDSIDWQNKTSEAMCFPKNSLTDSVCGALYNFFVVLKSDGLCPTGWHVPTNSDWEVLENYLKLKPADKLKYTSTLLWDNAYKTNCIATNESGFSAHPVGWRNITGQFNYYKQHETFFWSSDGSFGSGANCRRIETYSSEITKAFYCKKCGFSVRCIKNSK